MTDTTTSPAAFAWARLVDGAPLYEVFDWLREQLGTDDVGAVKRALYEAASDWAYAEKLRIFGFDIGGRESESSRASQPDIGFRSSRWDMVEDFIEWSRSVNAPRGDPWYKLADIVEPMVAICRQIEAL